MLSFNFPDGAYFLFPESFKPCKSELIDIQHLQRENEPCNSEQYIQEPNQFTKTFNPNRERCINRHVIKSGKKNKSDYGFFQCRKCSRPYQYKRNLVNHLRFECGMEPKFNCNLCSYRCKIKGNLTKHTLRCHAKNKCKPPN